MSIRRTLDKRRSDMRAALDPRISSPPGKWHPEPAAPSSLLLTGMQPDGLISRISHRAPGGQFAIAHPVAYSSYADGLLRSVSHDSPPAVAPPCRPRAPEVGQAAVGRSCTTRPRCRCASAFGPRGVGRPDSVTMPPAHPYLPISRQVRAPLTPLFLPHPNPLLQMEIHTMAGVRGAASHRPPHAIPSRPLPLAPPPPPSR
jgi:hypothetical protein